MSEVMSTQESNKEVVGQYVEALNQGDMETLRRLFTPDALIYGVLGWGGLDEVVPIWQQLHQGLAMELTAEQMVAEDDTVAVRYTERGTFRDEFLGNQPTGESYELVAMEWFVLRDGRIHRRWGARDGASQARQIGLPLG
ncbi:MAG: nuclear transport factor 2 family protein [Actinomycetota bacterium]|nr:nuclear transport factor 2 family protein [Actinomycetota bacterium]